MRADGLPPVADRDDKREGEGVVYPKRYIFAWVLNSNLEGKRIVCFPPGFNMI